MGRKTKTLAEQLAELDNPAPRGTAKKKRFAPNSSSVLTTSRYRL
jgi:hypothetical protein